MLINWKENGTKLIESSFTYREKFRKIWSVSKLTCKINRKFTYASARSSENNSTKIKFTCVKNRKFTNVSREVPKKNMVCREIQLRKKESSVMCSEKFIHNVTNFRSDSRIGSSPVVNEKFRKSCSSKEIHFKKKK